MADGTKVGSAYVDVKPRATGNFKSLVESQMGDGSAGGLKFGSAFSDGMIGAATAGAVAVGNILADMVETGAQAAMSLVGDAFSGFADYQQLVGGVETLMGAQGANSAEEYAELVGKSVDEVAEEYEMLAEVQRTALDNAAAAYETAGMSANEYMETVTGFSASLKAGLGDEYAWQLANYADMAVQDMSDNANKMGTEMASIQNAYSGFAKQNFTMLDNLKLGYGGTKEEMERLMRDAERMEGLSEGAFSTDNFADVVDAIHIVQENMGITGTTAEEAAKTVSGSMGMMQAAWQNWVAGLGNPDADLDKLTGDLLSTLGTFLDNALPVAGNVVSGIASALPGLIEALGPVVVPAVTGMLATVAPAVISLAPGLLSAGIQLFGGVVEAAILMLPLVVQTVIAAGPSLWAAALDFFGGIGRALGEVAPLLVDGLVYVVTHLPDIIVGAAGLMWDAGTAFFTGLVDGITGKEPEVTKAGEDAASALAGAMASSDMGGIGAQMSSDLAASFDFSEAEASVTTGMDEVLAAASEAAGSADVLGTLATGSGMGFDTSAMDAQAVLMTESAVGAALSVDSSVVGREFSQKAASGIDVGAMADVVSKAAGALEMNRTATVGVQADLSGVEALSGAAGQVSSLYSSMASSIEASMARASSAAASAAREIRSSLSIPSPTVYVNVARGNTVLPHFSMSGTFDAKTGSVPTVNVSWWEKGGIFTEPAIIGVAEGREPEGVFPLSKLEDMLGRDEHGRGGDTYIIEKVEYLPDSEMARYARGLFAESRRLGRM